ncbi:hypothetical protein [Microcoleus sp. CAWBG58]|uniref:hypothetical protein n=1 Tax=Microcoleus sp. CAWBG58 TaxID=2841651 RepID=UPI0025FA4384|nr:hypothetical protein [Microcoleus sp. CAWBG58]
MADNKLEGTDTFRRSLTSASGTGVVEILNCADAFSTYTPLATAYVMGLSFYLEALSGAVHLPSLRSAPFPDVVPEMTSSEKIAALMKVEKEYPYIGLRFHARKGSGTWSDLATALLQNRGRETTIPFVIPYLTINQLKLLSPADRLGVSIINYGHGVLGVGDYINLEGDFRFTVDLIAKPANKIVGTAIPYGVNIPSASPTRFRSANANRAIFYATNTGTSDIWIAGNSSVAVGSGIYLGAGGGSLTEETLTGELWAIAEGAPSRISGVEASYV